MLDTWKKISKKAKENNKDITLNILNAQNILLIT